MILGLDWDETFTADPELWAAFVRIAGRRGHRVVIVTYRYPRHVGDIRRMLRRLRLRVPLLATSRRPKRPYALAHGFDVDVWIDDLPELIPKIDGRVLA